MQCPIHWNLIIALLLISLNSNEAAVYIYKML